MTGRAGVDLGWTLPAWGEVRQPDRRKDHKQPWTDDRRAKQKLARAARRAAKNARAKVEFEAILGPPPPGRRFRRKGVQ